MTAFASYSQQSKNQNYVITNIIKQSAIVNQGQVDGLGISIQEKSQSIAYFDGLGRPLQSVTTKASASQQDIVTGIEYDQYGREVKKYLPYSESSGTNGSYRSGWKTSQALFYNGQIPNVDIDASPFAQSVPESSPLNRVLAQGAPGTVWQPNLSNPYDASTHSVKVQYLINTALDSVRLMNMDSAGNFSSPGFYPAGQLNVKMTADEQQQFVKEFTDKSGHIVCKRVMMANDSLQTYYIYDNLELLRAVIQPEGTVALKTNGWVYPTNFATNWMFLYRYDQRARMVMKKIPGADSVVMMYDQWDRVVLTQDGNLRAANGYLFTKYDALNRPVVTGQITDSRGNAAVRTDVGAATGRFESVNTAATEGYTLNNSFPSSSAYTLTVYTTTHYDDYNNLPSWKSSYAFVNENGVATPNVFLQGQVVATQTKILGTSNYMRTVTYYDDKYRVIQVTADNAAGGTDRITKILSFDGKVTNDYHSHTSRFYTTAMVIKQVYTYDHVDRLLTVTHQTANQEVVTLSQNAYNEVGQLLNKKLHFSSSHPYFLQKLDYYYNIRGWLNSVNRPLGAETGYEESDLFNEELHYNNFQITGINTVAQFNGNIAEEIWKGGYDEYIKGYGLTYDKANRLLTSTYAFQNFNQYGPFWSETKKYSEDNLSYDRNGNILTMNRYHGDWNVIDQLHYFGYTGNKLGRVEDWSPTNSTVIGFQDKNNGGGNDYTYDVNGNLISDYNKSITSTTYNFLNLPTLVTITSKGTIAYTYDAAGNKLQKTTTDQTVTPNKITNYYYAGDFVYRNDTLEFISHPEGRLRPMRIDTTQPISIANLKYIYDYFLKDHLGSVRSVISTEQQTSIYAATMEAANATKENQLFSNISSTSVAKVGGFDSDNTNGQISQLNGNTTNPANKRVGPSIVLKVMAGDTISISTYAWYTGAVQGPASETGITPIANDILPLLTGGVVANNGTHGGAVQQSSINGWLSTVLNNFISGPQTTAYTNTRPKAFLNWIIVDEEFNATTSINHVGAAQVPLITGTTQKQPLPGPTNMVVRRNGWLYVYVSNEADQMVYFDDLVINHKRGPLTEQKDYYAFGLEIPGLSTQAAKPFTYNPNRYKFNGGNELQSKEFFDGSGLELYDAKNRTYDPQIGRFLQIDELGEVTHNWSSYSFAVDNPIKFNDPLGLDSLSHGYNLPPVYVVAKHTTENLRNTYWNLIDSKVDLHSVQDRGLRNWLLKYDDQQKYMDLVHKGIKETQLAILEYSLWFAGAGEFAVSARLGSGALKLFAIKRGLGAAISGGADLTSQLIANNGNFAKVNPVSTVSSALLANPFTGSIPGSFVNLSINSLQTGTVIKNPTDVNVYKNILITTIANFGAEKFGNGLHMEFNMNKSASSFVSESSFGVSGSVIDEQTHVGKKE
ncbi:MAG: hypothetical protein JST75_09355 [Bacteroidetes bacterium]|nr:hypothetical protein [Bacteroidota bacterium]